MDTVSVQKLGNWEVRISSESVGIGFEGRYVIQEFLNTRWLPCVRTQYAKTYNHHFNWSMRHYNVPSLLVRVDMPPMKLNAARRQEEFPGFYEVESNPAGYGVAYLTGVNLWSRISESLVDLNILKVGYGAAPSRADQLADLRLFMQTMPSWIETTEIDISSLSVDSRIPLWLRAGQEDMHLLEKLYSRCLLLHQDGGGRKDYLCSIGGAKLLADCDDPFREFGDGFALKPVSGWGSQGVEVWTSLKAWYRSGTTRTRMTRVIESIQEQKKTGEFLVQPFLPPEIHENRFRIWRVYAVWHPSGEYRVIRGVWSERPSLRVHGASDTIEGPIVLS